ncbi:MAG: glycosyltransferase family 39 protein [bacterium]|nr:glycosyltransferase family 39 protein [bacterium]
MILRALLLLAITVAACLPQLLVSDLRGTEGRRIQIAREMASSDSWMVPILGAEPTLAKPPLHYWVLGWLSEAAGTAPWILRLPAVFALFAMALLAMVFLRRTLGPGAGWVGALGVIAAPLAMFEWATAEIDPMFAALTAMSLWCLAVGVSRRQGMLVIASGVLGGLALLQKGPPFFVFATGAYLVWWRRRGLALSLHHFVPLLVVPLAYYVPLWLEHVSPSEMLAVAQAETIGRMGGFRWEHAAKTPLFWARAVLIQLPLVLWCFWEWRGRRDARMDSADLMLRMCSGAAVVAIVILTFFPGRPTRYLLPNVPLFTFAVAPAVAHFASQVRPLGIFSRRVLRVMSALAAIALAALPLYMEHVGLAIAGALVVVGLGPMLVRTPRHLVTFALALPVIAAWTAGLDRALSYRDSARAAGPVGDLVRREFATRGAVADLQTWGHVDSKMLLGGELIVPGDEFCRAQPQARFVLTTHGGTLGPLPAEYRDRVWFCSARSVFSLHERPE